MNATDLDLDALVALEAAATPRRWVVDEVIPRHIGTVDGDGSDMTYIGSFDDPADAAFIAAAREAVPALVQRVRDAEAERDRATADLRAAEERVAELDFAAKTYDRDRVMLVERLRALEAAILAKADEWEGTEDSRWIHADDLRALVPGHSEGDDDA